MRLQTDEQGHHAAQSVAIGPMCFVLTIAMPSPSAPRHRHQVAALRGMLALMLAHAGIVRHDMQMLAAPLRARIAEPHSMHHVRIQAAFAPEDARDEFDLAVLYDVCECSAACSMGGAGRR